MGRRVKSGLVAEVSIATKGTLVKTGDLADATYHTVNEVDASASGFPNYVIEGTTFITPETGGTPITLGTEDSAWPLSLEKICKVNFSIDSEYGVIEITDDCAKGQMANIIDGLNGASGTLTGFLAFDEATGGIKDVSLALLNRFFDKVTDDGQGNYVHTPKSNEQVLLRIILNSDETTSGKIQNILIIPAILTSVSLGQDSKGAQTRDFNWTIGQDPAYIYQRTIA